jgi:predicted enzyme related to lactoylglutathione lyase
MGRIDTEAVGRFCWVDLAASDAATAKCFYSQLLGWTSHDCDALGGVFTCLRNGGADIGSLYQLKQSHLVRGVPSHWTPYVRIADMDATIARAEALVGEVIVPPFTVPGMARVALILDAVGALVGLWQPVEAKLAEEADV